MPSNQHKTVCLWRTIKPQFSSPDTPADWNTVADNQAPVQLPWHTSWLKHSVNSTLLSRKNKKHEIRLTCWWTHGTPQCWWSSQRCRRRLVDRRCSVCYSDPWHAHTSVVHAADELDESHLHGRHYTALSAPTASASASSVSYLMTYFCRLSLNTVSGVR